MERVLGILWLPWRLEGGGNKLLQNTCNILEDSCLQVYSNSMPCDMCGVQAHIIRNTNYLPLLQERLSTAPCILSLSLSVRVFFLLINIQHAPLRGNITCFMVKYSQCGYIHLKFIYIFFFYRYCKFTFGFLMYCLLFFILLSTALLTK